MEAMPEVIRQRIVCMLSKKMLEEKIVKFLLL